MTGWWIALVVMGSTLLVGLCISGWTVGALAILEGGNKHWYDRTAVRRALTLFIVVFMPYIVAFIWHAWTAVVYIREN